MFDKNGNLLFTLQNSNMIGRLIPQTGEIKLVTMPQPRSQPYGMVVATTGPFYFDEFGANRIGEHRSEDDGDQGVHAAERRLAAAAHRDYARRHDLVRGLLARLPGAAQSEDRRGQGMGVAERSAVAAVRNHNHQRHHLVQRVGGLAEHARALRPEDREVPDAGSSRPAAAWSAT